MKGYGKRGGIDKGMKRWKATERVRMSSLGGFGRKVVLNYCIFTFGEYLVAT